MFKSIAFEIVGPLKLACEGCEQRVQRLLKGLPGVSQVHAEARTQRVEVLFDAALVPATAISEHLRRAGYETRVDASPSTSD